jgi:predicted nucleic acid-binding protein
MSGRFFLDTNVFIYSFDQSAPVKMQRAHQLILEAIATRKGVISYQIVQEFFNFALRRINPPMTTPDGEQYLNVVFRPLLAVHSSPLLYNEALRMHGHYHLAWYDSLIVAAATEAGCEILYSEDLQDGQRFGTVQVKNPFT